MGGLTFTPPHACEFHLPEVRTWQQIEVRLEEDELCCLEKPLVRSPGSLITASFFLLEQIPKGSVRPVVAGAITLFDFSSPWKNTPWMKKEEIVSPHHNMRQTNPFPL